jgi:hypothetical protein
MEVVDKYICKQFHMYKHGDNARGFGDDARDLGYLLTNLIAGICALVVDTEMKH